MTTQDSHRIAETLKAKIDELDIDRRLNELVEVVEDGVRTAVTSAGSYASSHADDVERLLETTSTRINERTDGKYADHVARVRQQVTTGLSKLAARGNTQA